MKALIKTNFGNIEVELYPQYAPQTVENFTKLATGEKEWTNPHTGEKTTAPLYDGVVFHRVIDGFMIQGGDPLGTGTGGPGYAFDDEISQDVNFDEPYILAMANAGTRMGRGTNGSQFFITVAPTPWLHGKHTVFGKVNDPASREVVDKIAATPTGFQDRPVQDVVIETIEITE